MQNGSAKLLAQNCLSHFQRVSEISACECALIRLKNADTDPQDRYRELLRTSRLWRNIKYRKWNGFGHGDLRKPGSGSLALFCAACPQPGINLPTDWIKEPIK